jgi:hypothetical protein
LGSLNNGGGGMKKVLVGFVLIALVSTVFVSCARASDITANIYLNKPNYSNGETVQITFSVKNNGSYPYKYTFNNSMIYDFVISSGGSIVYQWSHDKMFADVITYLTIGVGETKTFSEKWDMKDNSGKTISDGTYQIKFFLALSTQDEVSAFTTFTIGSQSETPVFKDVSDPIVNKYLRILVYKNLVKGYPDKTFRPNNNLTRSEGLVLIMRVLQINPLSYSTTPFSDVAKNFWAFNYIAEGVKKGIIKGVSPTGFSPNTYISRGEFTVMLVRAINLDLTATQSPFVDVDETYFGYKEIIAAYNAGIVTGVQESGVYFFPQQSITRGESIIELGKAVGQ